MFTLVFVSPLTSSPTFLIFSVYRLILCFQRHVLRTDSSFINICIIVFILTLIFISDYGIINSRVRSRCAYSKAENRFYSQ